MAADEVDGHATPSPSTKKSDTAAILMQNNRRMKTIKGKRLLYDVPSSLDDSSHAKESTEKEKQCALLAGKAAFGLEEYIFRKVLPARLIKPYIFPRNIDDLSSLIAQYKCLGEEAALEGAERRWEILKEILQWDFTHEQVLESLKHSYLMINPSLHILQKLSSRDLHDIKEIRKAFRIALPVHLRRAGYEIADMLIPLGLTKVKMK